MHATNPHAANNGSDAVGLGENGPTGLIHFPAAILEPDPQRVMLRPFTPADEPREGIEVASSRIERVCSRVLALKRGVADAELLRILRGLQPRHVNPRRVLQRRFYEMAAEGLRGRALTSGQKLLIGSYFVEEYAFEAAALFNPSVVLHPDQGGLQPGRTRLLLSLRAVGEGHISSIVFRTAELSDTGELDVTPAGVRVASPRIERIPGGAPDDRGVQLRYSRRCDPSSMVIFPVTAQQRGGVEDLRLVRFVEDDGRCSYIGTYTAFSGLSVRQELLRTDDFVTYQLNALRGRLSATKGMALFPRRIDGRYAMLGRQDHENIWLLKSGDLYEWNEGAVILSPRWPWEFIQMGNCGSPIEIDEGWLVITHGVGAVRTYCLGACLLDRRDPTKVLARTVEPLLRPQPNGYNGFVPNVAYSCGAFASGRTLMLPFGVADTMTSFAVVSLDRLLQGMR
ncbi:MAG TPA: glycoside hydrolase family 130 protein [Novosphingobium sp.]